MPVQEIFLGPIGIRFLIDGTTEPSPLSMFEFSVAAGAKVPIAHSHDGYEETCYGLEGNLTLTLWTADGTPERRETGPGDSVVIPRGVVHRFDNFSSATTRTLAIITPGILGAAYFREVGEAVAAAVASRTAPDPAAIAAIMRRHGLTHLPVCSR